MKNRIKRMAEKVTGNKSRWFIAGFLAAMIIMPSMLVAANQLSLAGEVFTGLRFFINDVEMNVRWDEETGSVHLSSPHAAVPPIAPMPPTGTMLGRDIQAFRLDRMLEYLEVFPRRRVATIMGIDYSYGLTTSGSVWFGGLSVADSTASAFYNIGGRYTSLTGYFGPRDDTNAHLGGRFEVFGDGRRLGSFNVATGDPLRPFNVDVSGVIQLRIDFVRTTGSGTGFRFAIVDAVLR